MDRGITFTKTITLVTETCYKCGVIFAFDKEYQQDLIRSKNEFYCPNGHQQSYTGTDYTKALNDAKEKLAKAERERIYEESKRMEAERQLDKANKKLKRVHNGVCPCCNRSFENLRRHMETKHPDELKNFIKLINNPNKTTSENAEFAKEKGLVFLNQLTLSEKKKLNY